MLIKNLICAIKSCDVMNKWIYDATKGKISNMINPPIYDDIIMYLMNAIYFKGSWAYKFDVSQTKGGTFTNIKGKQKTVPMMNKTDAYKYFENDELKAIELPYGSGNTSMYCILPEANDVNDFIAKFDNSKWNEIQSKLELTGGVKVSIPRFKFEYSIYAKYIYYILLLSCCVEAAAYFGLSGRRFRNYPDTKLELSGHLVCRFDFMIIRHLFQYPLLFSIEE